MRKWHKILLLIIGILIILILITLSTSSGRFFWKQSVINPSLKPFSEACGYGGTSSYRIDCDCDGTLLSDIKIGATLYHCRGECGQCKCYKQDWSTHSETGQPKLSEVDCTTFSQLDWAFPLE